MDIQVQQPKTSVIVGDNIKIILSINDALDEKARMFVHKKYRQLS
jgi:hypothetical protein